MTATRIVRGATIAVAVAVWVALAALLWRTNVPNGLRLPRLDENAVFGRELVRDAQRYERLLDLLWLGATLTEVAVLVVLVRRGRRLARGLGLGPINAGIVVGVVSLTILWAAGLPWTVASAWWQRRHGVSYESYAATLAGSWATLLATTFVAFVVIAVILGYAKPLRGRWWLAAVPTVVVLTAILQFAIPYLVTIGTHPLRSGQLKAQIAQLERREDAGNPPIRVQTVSNRTRAANAYSLGIGPSERVVFWDTLLREFRPAEIRFVAAHELAHLARNHIVKAVGWVGLFTLPILGLVALVTERRGGLREPANVPLGLLVLIVTTLAALPLRNEISRRYETEADWIALENTRDPGAARGLFTGFSAQSLQDPTPPGWVHVFLDDHPTVLQRIELARAWVARNR
jgi:Zn-dependent protease with chaperone function